MAQFARPDADTNNPGLWTDAASGTTNLWDNLNETVADDTDYIQTPSGPSAAVIVEALSSVTDPVSSSGHVFRFRYKRDVAGTVNVTFQLRQGYASESSLGTLIAESVQSGIGASFTTTALTLSGSEADAITNYGDLFGRIVATQA